MPIKNYTTKIDVFESLGEIQGALARNGARKIMVDYDDRGRPVGITFGLQTAQGGMLFQLPANTPGVMAAFERQKIRPDVEQAERENPQPLTLEDLRGMDGEWVWAISSDPDLTVSAWAYIVASQAHTLWEYKPDRLLGNVQLDFENYGKTWLAYRSKPKEGNR